MFREGEALLAQVEHLEPLVRLEQKERLEHPEYLVQKERLEPLERLVLRVLEAQEEQVEQAVLVEELSA